MKQEEMSDVSTILIEATDERTAVMSQVSKQNKPVIIVLPEQARQIFRQPGDFFELKRIKRERGLSITLVINGHEHIRSMARRQGFLVFASTETCARAMARRDRLYAMRGITLPGLSEISAIDSPTTQADEPDDDVPWSWDVNMSLQQAVAETHTPRTGWMLTENQLWDNTSHNSNNNLYRVGAGLAPAHDLAHSPIPENSALVNQEVSAYGFSALANRGETPLPPLFTDTLENLVALPGERGALLRPMRLIGLPGERVADSVSFAPPAQRSPDTEPLHLMLTAQPLATSKHPGSKLVLVLTVLLILGILGGLGFGYLLSLMHINLAILSFVGSF